MRTLSPFSISWYFVMFFKTFSSMDLMKIPGRDSWPEVFFDE
jgi:hypothetical protein